MYIKGIASILEEFKVPHIIYFTFHKNKENDMAKRFIQDLCIRIFTLHFYSKILNGDTIIEAFMKADVKMHDYISKYTNLNRGAFEKHLGKGPRLVPDDPSGERKIHDRVFLTKDIKFSF